MNRSSTTVACVTIALALAPGMAQAAPTVTVNVGGLSYDVTYFEGAYNANTAKFQAPPAGQMPWWGDSALAKSFATQIGAQLGLPMFGQGPYFAYDAQTRIDPHLGLQTRVITWAYSPTAFPNNIFDSPISDSFSYVYATASLTPNSSAVPGPVPLFGAAAAFGVSRRLRRRCQLGG